MRGDPKDYLIVSRYLVKDEGWKTVETKIGDASYEVAGMAAVKEARRLDATYGDDHFWTVELHLDPKGEYGAFFQLFHGRTS